MKAIILTHKLRSNYGGLLQAYALQYTIKQFGIECYTDNSPVPDMSYLQKLALILYKFFKGYICNNKSFRPIFPLYSYSTSFKIVAEPLIQFVNRNITTIDFLEKGRKTSLYPKYDLYVVGSDQVWRYSESLYDYFGSFGIPREAVLISFSASFGLDSLDEYPHNAIDEVRRLIKRFDAVSVREESGVDICKKEFGINAICTIDPTFLLSPEDYNALIKQEEVVRHNKFICSYILDISGTKQEIVDKIKKLFSLNVISNMPECEYSIRNPHQINKCIFPSVQQWLYNIKEAEFVVTDSFHGVVFSIIYKKQFVAIANEYRGKTRFVSLLGKLGLMDRLISNGDIIEHLLVSPINYDDIDIKKTKWVEESFAFLRKEVEYAKG